MIAGGRYGIEKRVSVYWFMFAIVMQASSLVAAKQESIGVIGAGLAGLTAAHRLHQQGYDVVIYEAADYAGGRVRTWHASNSYEELGGKNINDGGQAPHLRALLAEFGLREESYECRFNPLICTESGEYVSASQAFKSLSAPTEQLHAEVSRVLSAATTLEPAVALLSKQNPLVDEVLNRSLCAYEGGVASQIDGKCSEVLWYLFQSLEKIVDNSSHSSFAQVQGGNDRLVEALLQSLFGRIRLGTPVTAIATAHDGGLELRLGDDSKVSHDRVVCAVPCTVFAEQERVGSIAVQRGLIPEEQLAAIRGVSYAYITKVIFQTSWVATPPAQLNTHLARDGFVWFSKDGKLATLYLSGSSQPILQATNQERQALLARYAMDIQVVEPTIKDIVPVAIAVWPVAYSYFSPGQYAIRSQIEKFASHPVRSVFKPVNAQLFFAGEHTGIPSYACMEAAVESGERTARMIIDAGKPEAAP